MGEKKEYLVKLLGIEEGCRLRIEAEEVGSSPPPTGPVLSVDKTTMNFGTDTVTDTFTITNVGDGILTWHVGDDEQWMTIDPNDGTATADDTDIIEVTMRRGGLDPGIYTGIINITSDGGNATITVEMQVSAVPPPPSDSIPEEWVNKRAVLQPGPPGSWDVRLDGALTPCTMIKRDGQYLLYYIGSDGDRSDDGGPKHRALGVATSTDGENFTKYPGNPILTFLPTPHQEEGVFSLQVLDRADGGLDMFFTGSTATSPTSTSVNTDIRYATSPDGFNVTDRGMIMDHDDRGVWGHGDELFAMGTYKRGSTYYTYYTATNSQIKRRMGVGWGPAADSRPDSKAFYDPGQRIYNLSGPMEIGGKLVSFYTLQDGKLQVRVEEPSKPDENGDLLHTYTSQPSGSHNMIFRDDDGSYKLIYSVGDKTKPLYMMDGRGSIEVGEPTPPPSPPPPPPPPPGGPCKHPAFPYIAEGHCVSLHGVTYNTRFTRKTRDEQDYFWIGQRNGTATYIGLENRGKFRFKAWYEPDVLEVGGGGKHFHEVTSYVGDRAGQYREDIGRLYVSRFEICKLGTRPQGLLWNYGPDINIRDALKARVMLGDVPPLERWIDWEIEWTVFNDFRIDVVVTRDGQEYRTSGQLHQDTVGPGNYAFPYGHVETNSGVGSVRFKDISFSS